MTSILFLTEAIYCNILRSHYLTNEKYRLNFFFEISKFRLYLEHFFKKDDPHSWCILELTDSERRAWVNV